MAFKKKTFIYLPDGGKKARQINVPRFLLVSIPLLVFVALLFSGYGVWSHRTVKGKTRHLKLLQKEHLKQREQLFALKQEVDRIGQQTLDLKKLDDKIRMMVNLDLSEDNEQLLGIGGSNPQALFNTEMTAGFASEDYKNWVRNLHQTIENVDTLISTQTNGKTALLKTLETQRTLLAHTPSIWPTRGWISSRFGHRVSPFTNQKEFHRGLDICTKMNTPIIAPADGVVASSKTDYGYGKVLSINHGYGLKTRYAHLSKVLVKRGQHIKRGDKIALVGNTGRSTGPHLHYEVKLKGVQVDPYRYILN